MMYSKIHLTTFSPRGRCVPLQFDPNQSHNVVVYHWFNGPQALVLKATSVRGPPWAGHPVVWLGQGCSQSSCPDVAPGHPPMSVGIDAHAWHY